MPEKTLDWILVSYNSKFDIGDEGTRVQENPLCQQNYFKFRLLWSLSDFHITYLLLLATGMFKLMFMGYQNRLLWQGTEVSDNKDLSAITGTLLTTLGALMTALHCLICVK